MATKNKEVAIVPNLAAQVVEEQNKREVLAKYVKHNMVVGTDFYSLKIGGKETKPSLSKPGSEKVLSLFHWRAEFVKDNDTWEMLGSPAGVLCYICKLYTIKGDTLVGEGRGARDSKKDNGDINKAIKMAEKSAQIDAVLRTGGLSDLFTQDIEDMQQGYDTSKVPAKTIPTVHYDDVETTGEQIEIPKDEESQWKIITNFAKQIDRSVKDKKGVERVVSDTTQLALNPKNFPAIIREMETELQFKNINR